MEKQHNSVENVFHILKLEYERKLIFFSFLCRLRVSKVLVLHMVILARWSLAGKSNSIKSHLFITVVQVSVFL